MAKKKIKKEIDDNFTITSSGNNHSCVVIETAADTQILKLKGANDQIIAGAQLEQQKPSLPKAHQLQKDCRIHSTRLVLPHFCELKNPQ